MLKLGLRGVLAHRLRFALCIVAVVLGVAFVAGSMIFTDTLASSLRKEIASTTADLTVTAASALEQGDKESGGANAKAALLDADLVARLEAVNQVATADAQLLVGGVRLIGKDGRPHGIGRTMYGASWPHEPVTATFSMVEGNPPWGPAEVTLDSRTAEDAGFGVGDTVRIVTAVRTVEARLTGLITPATTGPGAGAPLVAFDAATAQRVLQDGPGWTSVAVRADPGADLERLRTDLQTAGGDGVRVRTAAEVIKEAEDGLDTVFGGAGSVLALFAGLALFVGSFLIVNTFAMLVTQRVRELGLLRAVGASRGQVTRSVLAEALVIGVTGSTLGLGFGIGLVVALRAVFGAIGVALPESGLQVRVSTVVWCYLLGVGVTAVAAYLPARRAGRISPVAALRAGASLAPASMRNRLVAGVVLLATAGFGYPAGTAAGGLPGAFILALSAGLALIGASLVSPLLGRYAVPVLAWPLRRSPTVLLGGKNAQRNPRRTSATASALMIALAVVSSMAVLASSARASIDQGIAEAFGTADYVVQGTEGQAFGGEIATKVAAVPQVGSVGRKRAMVAEVGRTRLSVFGVDPAVLGGPIVAATESGSLDRLAAGEVVLPANLARTLEVTVGSTIEVATRSGTHRVRVGAVLAANRQLDAIVGSLETFTRLGGASTDSVLYVDLRDGVDPAAAAQPLATAIASNPLVEVRDQTQFAASQRAGVDNLVGVVYVLLVLAILIAVLGIVNTLLLSVLERTREIGLLRAIGMDRSQVRAMVRVESIAIALLGALLGVGLGVLFAVGIRTAMRDDGLGVRDVPVLQLFVVVAAAALVGVLAALGPARRAARLDVLRAIGTE